MLARLSGLASCHSRHAVKVSDPSRSAGSAGDVSVPTSVTCLYRTKLRLPPDAHLDTYLTWSDSPARRLELNFAVQVDDETHAVGPVVSGGDDRGGRRLASPDGPVVSVCWDVSTARYGGGPEPREGFYVGVEVDGEVALQLGDKRAEEVGDGRAGPEVWVKGRVEKVGGDGRYTRKARLRGEGREHDIRIECRKESELWVWVDKRKVVQVRRLRWNYRGNQTIFVDGAPVDVMWDVYEWCFRSGGGGLGVFTFRARQGMECGLWLEEELAGRRSCAFALLIHAYRYPSTTPKRRLLRLPNHCFMR